MKKLSRRDFLKLTGLAIAGAVASQIPIKETPPYSPSVMMESAGRQAVDGFAEGIKHAGTYRPWQGSMWADLDKVVIGKDAGKDCNYTVLVGTTAEPYGWYHRTLREMGCY